ncbi:MAG TPA: serine/threonine-protein kinase [Polyangia bacterium]|jgi:serine/threonine-protein kinase|nr:serine/threonine-protein kinase [Polyangia bacterium]
MAVHGRYTIAGKLADGGMAEIFLGTQHGAEGFEKPVVLKRIHTAFSADPQFRNMFIDEAHISMSLSHGNIVQVLDLGVSNGRYFLVLELVDGWDLHQVLKRARAAQVAWPPALALYVAAELCRALAFAHAKNHQGRPLGIVHRDVSPNNVLLSEQGEVKLADFGIAKAQRKREQTAAGVIKGKVAFMSPEQATGSAIDRRSDLFSVGTMLYMMVTDQQPFEGANDLEALSRVQRADFVPPDVLKPSLSPALVRLIGRAMRLSTSERYQTADEMLTDIERVLRTEYQSAGQTELKQWLAQLARRDGAPTISKRLGAAPVAGAPADGGTDLNAGTSFELGDLDLVSVTELAPTPPPLPTPSPGRATPTQKEGTPRLTSVEGAAAGSTPTPKTPERPRRFGGFWLGVTVAFAAVIGLRYFGEWAAHQGLFGATNMAAPAPAAEPTAMEPAPPTAAAPTTTRPAATADNHSAATAAAKPTNAPAVDAGQATAPAEPAAAARPVTASDAGAAPTTTAAANKAPAPPAPAKDDSDDDSDEETLLKKADPNAASAVIGEEEAAPAPPAPLKKDSAAPSTKNNHGAPPAAPASKSTAAAAKTPAKPAPYVTVSLHITSAPVGAVVRINKRVLGRTPINLRFKTDNMYDLIFVKDGYTPLTKRFAVHGTHDGHLTVSLKKKPPPPSALRSLFHPHR